MTPEPSCACTRCRPIASASSRRSTAGRSRRAISPGPSSPGHDSFQRGQAFIDAGGCRGLQEEVLLSGSWNLNPWFVQVELVPLTEIPIGYVGVVVSYVGDEHLDVSGDAFTHGDLVERGRKGVWVEPLLPGKHPLNTRVMKVELVPTTNIVLNWAQRTEAHHYDERLSSILVRSKDGFSFSLDVSQIIHIGMKNAPRVISRVGSMQNLVDHVLQPTVGNYFRNSAQEVTVLEFLSARTRAAAARRSTTSATAIEAYDVECIDTLIGDIVPPAELMKTQTDRKIADELQRTYDVQREAQVKRQELERETAVAEHAGRGGAQRADGAHRASRTRWRPPRPPRARRRRCGCAPRPRRTPPARWARRAPRPTARDRRRSGPPAYTAMQIATILGERGIKLVPDIAVGGGAAGGGPRRGPHRAHAGAAPSRARSTALPGTAAPRRADDGAAAGSPRAVCDRRAARQRPAAASSRARSRRDRARRRVRRARAAAPPPPRCRPPPRAPPRARRARASPTRLAQIEAPLRDRARDGAASRRRVRRRRRPRPRALAAARGRRAAGRAAGDRTSSSSLAARACATSASKIDVAQLADVARPRVRAQRGQRRGRRAARPRAARARPAPRGRSAATKWSTSAGRSAMRSRSGGRRIETIARRS